MYSRMWQILKRFSRALSWAQTSYFWIVLLLPTSFGFHPKNGLMASWTRLFFIFPLIFAILDDFLKWSALSEGAAELWKNTQLCQKFAQKMKKVLFQLAFNPFFGWFREPENPFLAKIWFYHIDFTSFLKITHN